MPDRVSQSPKTPSNTESEQTHIVDPDWAATAMDKVIAKTLFAQAGLPQMPYEMVQRRRWQAQPDAVLATLADTLVMKDGSRLHGEVVRQEGGTLDFNTPYAGVIHVKWSEISEIESDRPMELFLTNSELISTQRIHPIPNG